MNHASADLIQIFIHSVLLVAAEMFSGLRPQRRHLGAAQ